MAIHNDVHVWISEIKISYFFFTNFKWIYIYIFFFFQQQEQDPTNLYIANLPLYFSEQNLENMLKDYGTVISTRILRKPDGVSRGVGFARMESKEKCEQVINGFNGKILPGKMVFMVIFQQNLMSILNSDNWIVSLKKVK